MNKLSNNPPELVARKTVCRTTRKAPAYEVDGAPAEIAAAEAARLEATYDTDRIKALIAADGWDAAPADT